MPTFKSFVQGGFECATHKNKHGHRLDIVHSSRHDQFLMQDYRRLAEQGIRTAREGLRWHLIEPAPGVFEFSSVERMVDLAQACGTELILDLMHFGWPDWLDVFSPEFPIGFERFARAVAPILRRIEQPYVIPVNEMSFLAWAGGEEGLLNPHARGRGGELKRQLVRAAILASNALRELVPTVLLATAEPVIHIVGRPDVPGDMLAAERHRLAMYEATDMLSGRICPELGGSLDLVDIFGLNFYDRNQWINHGRTLKPGDVGYRPFHVMLNEIWHRYRKPVFVSETGTEDGARPKWFEYVASETRAAVRSGVPVQGICLYPIVNHPGWDDDRHCHNGLWDYADDEGKREIFAPLARAMARERVMFGDIGKVA